MVERLFVAMWPPSDQVEGLARHPGPETLDVLTEAARADRSLVVRTEAVEALGELDMEQATGVLLEIAQSEVVSDRFGKRFGGMGDHPVIAMFRIENAAEFSPFHMFLTRSLGTVNSGVAIAL